jgi:hypothetical protein
MEKLLDIRNSNKMHWTPVLNRRVSLAETCKVLMIQSAKKTEPAGNGEANGYPKFKQNALNPCRNL